MRISAYLIVTSALMSFASFAGAAATEIVGKSKAGQKFLFTYGFPADETRISEFPLPPNTTADPTDMSGVQVTAGRKANLPEIYNESQCVMLSANNALLISCASHPKNALSGVVYQYKGTNKVGDGMYSCVVGCSNRVPRILVEVTLPSGC